MTLIIHRHLVWRYGMLDLTYASLVLYKFMAQYLDTGCHTACSAVEDTNIVLQSPCWEACTYSIKKFPACHVT
jgi:hypothetical protein